MRPRRPTPSCLPARMSPLLLHASLSTRQYAPAFNQPLSFDTSSVTTMYQMFEVRSARALPSNSTVGSSQHAACAAAAPTPSRLPACMSPLFLCFPFDSAGSVGVQPAAKLRHVQRHRHAKDVSGALRAGPARSLYSGLPQQCCLRRTQALPPPGLHVAPLPMLPFRLGRAPRRSTSR